MKVGLGFPYWGDDETRKKAFGFTQTALYLMYPWAHIYVESGSQTRGSARNAIVRRAEEDGCDVVVVCDADTIPTREALMQAITGAILDGSQHFPYDSYHYLTEAGTERYYQGFRDFTYEDYEMEGPGSYGGVFAVRPVDWWAAGGSADLTGWGFEDIIFVVQARTLVGETRWHAGPLTHLWHPSAVSVGSESYIRNLAICQKFESVDRNPEAIKALMVMGIGNHDPIGLARLFPGNS